MRTLMKSKILLFLFFLGLSLHSMSQIKVFDNNYVGINYNSTPSSRFVINHVGSPVYQAYIYSPNMSVSGSALGTLMEKGTGSGLHLRSLTASTNIGSSNYLYGIKTVAYSSTVYSYGRTYGIYAQAGNASSGYNYAVLGYIAGSNNGAAIYGTTSSSDILLSAKYAGYFNGNLYCNATIYYGTLSQISDEKYKTNITTLDLDEAVKNILKINPIKYNFKQVEVTRTDGDTISVQKAFDESNQMFTKTNFGVIAQELQKIYPDLVYEQGDGSLSVNYIGLIPVMIATMQAQQKKIESLERKINVLTDNN